jgi:hypothetical protein
MHSELLSPAASFAWIHSGSWLMVTACDAGQPTYTISKTDLAQSLGESNLKITAVTELKDHLSQTDPEWNPFLLLVVLERENGPQPPSSIICVFDGRLARLSLAIDCPFSVLCVEPVLVSEKGRAQTLVDCLPPEISCFHGAVLVGSAGGLVSILDLCLDQELDQVLPPCRLSYATRSRLPVTPDMDEKRLLALVHRQHIIYPLNCEAQSKNFFHYKTDKRTEFFNMSATQITCLKFIPQINAVCIAYNFAGYHVYDLKSKSLLFNGDLDISTAVVSFSFQEPENDPKNHCYLWMARGSSVRGWSEDGVASIHLNVISFQNKDWVQDFGFLYKDFISSTCLFDYECTGFPYLADRDNCTSSMIIDCGTLEQGSAWYLKAADEEITNDMSLYFIAWEATNESSDAPLTYFAIFDINQFYQSQMPRSFTVAKESSLCPYLGIFSLTEMVSRLSDETILHFHIHTDTIQKYRSNIYNHDLHYYPSSLSFDVSILTERSIQRVSYYGMQKLTISRILDAGSRSVIEPKDWLRQTYLCGLLPVDHARDADILMQRETLLLVMLQNDQLPFLISVVKHLSTGDYDHIGCSLKMVSEWIWNQVSQTKTLIDQISQPLFNTSSKEMFDENYAVKTLYSYETDLKNLSLLLKSILQHGTRLQEPDRMDLNKRLDITERIAMYLRVMLWMLNAHLLPERSESETVSESEVSYPKTILLASYKDRRKKLRALNPSLKSTGFLVIDGIIESVRDSVCPFWKKSGGSSVFPPPSIHALVGIYLLESVTQDQKHMITYYFLLDFAACIEDQHPAITDKIKLFPAAFSLKRSLSTFVSGVWGLDNGLFDFAFQQLIDPAVKKDFFTTTAGENSKSVALKADLHQRIVTCLVFQNNQVRAQQLDSLCDFESSTSPENSLMRKKIHISMLLTNNQVLEAYEFWKRNKTEETSDELLDHLLQATESMSLLKQLFKLSLSKQVQDRLEHYLLHISKLPQAKHLLVLYFLTNDKVVNAEKVLTLIRTQGEADATGKLASITQELHQMIQSYKSSKPAEVFELDYDSENVSSGPADEADAQTHTPRKNRYNHLLCKQNGSATKSFPSPQNC